jgi:PAS domain-containing protein
MVTIAGLDIGTNLGGVVITFTDITTAKTLEEELREENARLRSLLEGRE